MGNNAQCVILCGGLGSRLGDLTKDCPKPLLTIADRPLLDILIENIARFGFTDFILLAGYKGDMIWQRYRGKRNPLSHLSVNIRVVIEPEPAGTGGALTHAKALLESSFLMLNGDSFFDINYLDLVAAANSNDNNERIATIMMRQVEDASRCGVVDTKGDQITAFYERPSKPGPGTINSGIYWLKSEILNYIEKLPSSIERDIFPRLAEEGKIGGVLSEGFIIDIGIPEDLKSAQISIPAKLNRPAVFFDRDGVLNEDDGYTFKISEFRWKEGAKEAIRMCNQAGYYVFVVTNQAGIARGFYQPRDVDKLHSWMNNELFSHGAHIDDFQFCPFHSEGKIPEYALQSQYRKPGAGMIENLIEAWGVNIDGSMLIGDKASDIEAARCAGIKGLMFHQGSLADFVKTNISAKVY